MGVSGLPLFIMFLLIYTLPQHYIAKKQVVKKRFFANCAIMFSMLVVNARDLSYHKLPRRSIKLRLHNKCWGTCIDIAVIDTYKVKQTTLIRIISLFETPTFSKDS